jgi:hypothetical protein
MIATILASVIDPFACIWRYEKSGITKSLWSLASESTPPEEWSARSNVSMPSSISERSARGSR